jgi:hypothetical protein
MPETYADEAERELRGLAQSYTQKLHIVQEIERRREDNDLTAEQKTEKLSQVRAGHTCPNPSSCKIATYEGNPAP